MSERAAVPRNVQRSLWAESLGHCMNPDCQIELIKDTVNIGVMAHIQEHAAGGDVSLTNLILLCRNCHTIIDANRANDTENILRRWKTNRNSELEERFSQRFSSFERLKEAATPLLERNVRIFDSYGPLTEDPENSGRHHLWLRFEGEVVSNNRRLELILTMNKHLFHRENQTIVDSFIKHAHEFSHTRDDGPVPRFHLFPEELLSIFGVCSTRTAFPPSLNALQNFLSHLLRENCFVSLQLDDEPRITYLENGTSVTVLLQDRPRLQQIFWNGRFYRPQSTDVRIDGFVFFVQWLRKNNIRYQFTNMSNLTKMTLNREYNVHICYKYILSLSDVQSMALKRGDLVVNLHNWNGAPISNEAYSYASGIGVQLFSQKEFFTFAHQHIK